ncbi:cytochrome c oxidase accessory protein CcoG [Magnetospirillum sp. 64-120]|mgnify:CR=1 FL=1|uniref:cytochrome c oxidase accessory protein CcoG n=1 Tax=Magnetospirillum sp. 64-120 TaxID=1895778 RepID=UPI00092ACCFD|nr:cytochrome c oxidase accessory protein CcoG [Magnetospirillum sp. 64-120]OJX77471.1 MAG: cytochrome c oxidase accessory protein CcoG [Magnetospirillum sp. 64-120]
MNQDVQAPKSGGGSMYAETITIHPRHVKKGIFRSLKWWLMWGLLAFFHIAPFLRWDRGPDAPSQAILADIDGRRGYFFFIEIWPQEVYYLTGLLLFAAITLFFMSALAGRVWCGFLCWQTVYTDLFVQVERLVVGDRSKRMNFDKAKWSGEKLVKKAIVHAAWLAISAACGIAFTLYFGDAFQMLHDIFTLNASLSVYAFIAIIGGFCYLLAGFAREQVCLYMCPYSRFQSAMFDEHSLIISYEAWRGEPRAPARKGQTFEGRGHCIDCKMCVQVCPTGIDIREGLQMACIGCGLCVDACNSMMDRVGLPRGLISYDSITNVNSRASGGPGKQTRLVRMRTILYTLLLLVIGSGIVLSLGTRRTTEVNILHERTPMFVAMSDGSIRNGYTYKILNMVRAERVYNLKLQGIQGATMEVVGGEKDVTEMDLTVPGDQVTTLRLYVNAPEDNVTDKKTDITFILTEKGGNSEVRSHSLFAGPGR